MVLYFLACDVALVLVKALVLFCATNPLDYCSNSTQSVGVNFLSLEHFIAQKIDSE
jgi:hypothetical protein